VETFMHPTPSRHLSAGTCWRSAFAAAALALPALAAQAADTAPFGFDQPFDNAQPSLALHFQLPAIGPVFPQQESGDANSKALGIVRTYANYRAPFGEQLADGSLKPIANSQNHALFSLIGTQFGGDGKSTFAVPDLRGRVIVDAADAFIGDVTGSRETTLTVAQLPSHGHGIPETLSTGVTGGGQPVDNHQASLGLRHLIAIDSFYPVQGGSGAATPSFIGQVVASATNFSPGGFMVADGRLLPIAEHVALFSVIGTTYGGDGQETFALPDLRGRTIIGAGRGAGLTARSLGEVVGTDTFTLTESQMPQHAHALGDGTGSLPTGGNDSVNNLQPSLALTYLIATSGNYPPFDCCMGIEQTVLGEVTAFAGGYAPDGWMLADGRLLRINEYAALFSLLGTTYGGDGRTTFALPDLRGRAIVGADGETPVGTTFGTERFTLATTQLPSHVHTMPVPEPSTWVMLLAGLAGVAGIARRRR
jgi:microcystin-dependent protein